jgi:hypothetical protein
MIGFDRATLFGSHIEGFWLPQRIFLIAATSGAKKTAFFDPCVIGVEKNRQISYSSSSETKKTVEYDLPLHRRQKKRMELVSDVIGTEKNCRIVQTISSERKKRVVKPELHRA